jgi:precorrin-6B methylase 2
MVFLPATILLSFIGLAGLIIVPETTAVTLETQAEMLTLADIAKRHNVDFNMVQMAVTRSREAGPYHMMQAQNPVWIVTMG